jgi:hypothetical protein
MKKIAFLMIFLWGICLIQANTPTAKKQTSRAKFESTFSVALGAGARNFMGDEDDVYGFANLVFSLDVGFRFKKSFEVFLHGEYLLAKGELTITREETTLTIIPVEAGGRFLFGEKKFLGYLGAGLGFYLINEENPIGTVNQGNIGFFAEGGIRFSFIESIFADLKLKYVALSVRPEDTTVNLGGICILAGIGYTF